MCTRFAYTASFLDTLLNKLSRVWWKENYTQTENEANRKLALAQMVKHIRQFVEFWEPELLQILFEGESKTDRLEAAVRMKRMAKIVVHSARMRVNYNAVESYLFGVYIRTSMKKIYERFIAVATTAQQLTYDVR